MKGKKILSLLLAGFTALSCAACGSVSEGDITTVTIWTGESHSKNFITEQVDNFNKTTGKDNGIKIEYIVKPDIGQVLDMALVSDQAPDMFAGGPALDQLVSNDHIIAIDELPGGADYIKNYDDQYMLEGVHTYQGKTYTVPYATTTYGLVYNKDMFKAAGIVDENGEAKPPETLYELREDAKKLTNPQKQEYGIVFPAKWAGWFGSDINEVASACTGYINMYDPKTGKYNMSAVAEIMKVYMGIKEDGSYLPGADGLDNDPARSKFATGTIGMKFAASFDYAVFTDQFPAKCDWGVAPMPVLDKNENYKTFCYRGGYLYINKKSADKIENDKLMLVYKFMTGNDMLKEAYKAGKTIPYDYKIVDGIDIPENMDNWAAFAKLVDTSFTQIKVAKTDIEGKRNIVDTWSQDIWTGKVPVSEIDSIVKECEDISNDGIKAYQQQHPEYDVNNDIDPNHDTRIK